MAEVSKAPVYSLLRIQDWLSIFLEGVGFGLHAAAVPAQYVTLVLDLVVETLGDVRQGSFSRAVTHKTRSRNLSQEAACKHEGASLVPSQDLGQQSLS